MQRRAATAATAVGSTLLAACWRGVALRAANGTAAAAAAAAGAAAAAPTRLTGGSSAAALQWGPASLLESSQQRPWHQHHQQQHHQQQQQQREAPSSRSSSNSLWQHQHHQHHQHHQQQHALQQPLPLFARQHSLPLLLQHQHRRQHHPQHPHPQHHPQHQQHQQRRSFVLMPRRVKYRKAHKSMGFNETIVPNTRQLAFGLYGIRALEHARVPARTLEAIRRTLRRTVKKTTMMWIRVTPNVPVTSKPAEVRMGKGKGALDYWAAPIRPGQILFEFDRCSRGTAMAAVAAIQAKMPVKVGFVEWN